MKIGQVTDIAFVAKIVANGTIFVLSYWATISYQISMMAYNIRAATTQSSTQKPALRAAERLRSKGRRGLQSHPELPRDYEVLTRIPYQAGRARSVPQRQRASYSAWPLRESFSGGPIL
ncbi:hypothetical protein E4U15_007254 [Claviceps sp. LM218 group G6]|nr:hypothetical protein E4U15_007254 [Claviceps sp. LM218 group G6]